MTITFENVQNVRVQQGPCSDTMDCRRDHRHGRGAAGGNQGASTGHQAVIEGVDNAAEIRDQILRACAVQDRRLGDEDDRHHLVSKDCPRLTWPSSAKSATPPSGRTRDLAHNDYHIAKSAHCASLHLPTVGAGSRVEAIRRREDPQARALSGGSDELELTRRRWLQACSGTSGPASCRLRPLRRNPHTDTAPQDKWRRFVSAATTGPVAQTVAPRTPIWRASVSGYGLSRVGQGLVGWASDIGSHPGAASHTGQREIALFLWSRRAAAVTFAMLGDLEVSQAVLAVQRRDQESGPHDLPLLHHARVGGERSRGAGPSCGPRRSRQRRLDASQEVSDALIGEYKASGDSITLVVETNRSVWRSAPTAATRASRTSRRLLASGRRAKRTPAL